MTHVRTICAHPGPDLQVREGVESTMGAMALNSDARALRRRKDPRASMVNAVANAQIRRVRAIMRSITPAQRKQVAAAFSWMRVGYMVMWSKNCPPLPRRRR